MLSSSVTVTFQCNQWQYNNILVQSSVAESWPTPRVWNISMLHRIQIENEFVRRTGYFHWIRYCHFGIVYTKQRLKTGHPRIYLFMKLYPHLVSFSALRAAHICNAVQYCAEEWWYLCYGFLLNISVSESVVYHHITPEPKLSLLHSARAVHDARHDANAFLHSSHIRWVQFYSKSKRK